MHYNNMMSWGDGHMFGLGLIGWMLVIAFAVVVILWVTRWRIDRTSTDPRSEDRAAAILKERYARGEIDKAEFEALKRDLS